MTRPLRFCHLTTFFPPLNFGGDGIIVYRLSQELAARGHHVEVVHDADAYSLIAAGRPTPTGYPAPPGVQVHTLAGFPIVGPLVTHQLGVPGLKARRIRGILEAGRFDVVHFHNVSLLGGPGLLTYGPRDAVRVYSLLEHWLVCPMHVLWKFDREPCVEKACVRCQLAAGRPPQLWRHTPLLRRSLGSVDVFLAPSESTRARHLQELDIPIRVLPLAVGPEECDDYVPFARERPFFLFVGRLERLKGAHTLLPAFRRFPDADLVVIGDGAYAREVRRQAEGMTNVQFFGWRPEREVRGARRAALAVLVPSLTAETFGLVAVEAWAHGKPVIAHAMGALPELVEQSEGGLLYRNEDELLHALRRIHADGELRGRLGANGHRAWLERWTTAVFADNYLAVIDEVAQAKRRGI